MKIIITGGTGFIGTNLCIFLLEKKFVKKILLIDNLKSSNYQNYKIIKSKDTKNIVHFIKASISENNTINKIKKKFKTIDIIYHLAAQSSGENSFYEPIYDLDTNLLGTHNILNWCNELKIKQIIYSSTMSVYGDIKSTKSVKEDLSLKPSSIYGISKLMSEKYIKLYCKSYNIKFTILRLFNVYGIYQDLNNLKQGMLSIYLHYLLNRKKLIIKGSQTRVRDFVYVDDVCEAMFLSMHPKGHNKTFNIGTGKSITVKKLVNLMFSLLKINKKKYNIEFQPSTPGDVRGFKADIGKAKKTLKWNPKTDIEDGLNRTINFFKENNE